MSIVTKKRLAGLLLTSFAMYCFAACRSTYPTTKDSFTADRNTADLEHGRALLISSCGGCHYDPKTQHFTGKRMNDLPKILGKAYSANLTVSENGRTAHYTDAELAYLLRTGITKDGHFIAYMLRPNMADNDLRDLMAYLRSGKGVVASDGHIAGHTRMNFLGKFAMKFIAKPQPYQTNISRPSTPVEEGRYLVDNMGCFHCHSKKPTALNYLHPERSKGYMAGGATFKMPSGKVRGANITFDNETGIGFYTKEDFRHAVQHMIAPGSREIRPPMEAFELTDKEADAIYAYLNTLPRVHHRVKGQFVATVH